MAQELAKRGLAGTARRFPVPVDCAVVGFGVERDDERALPHMHRVGFEDLDGCRRQRDVLGSRAGEARGVGRARAK